MILPFDPHCLLKRAVSLDSPVCFSHEFIPNKVHAFMTQVPVDLVQKPAGSRSSTEPSGLKRQSKGRFVAQKNRATEGHCVAGSCSFISAVPAVRIPAQNASSHEHMGKGFPARPTHSVRLIIKLLNCWKVK